VKVFRFPYVALDMLLAEGIAMNTAPHRSPPKGANSRVREAGALPTAFAAGAALAGVGTLAAASLGAGGMRVPGLVFLAIGGGLATILRLQRERAARTDLEGSAPESAGDINDLATAEAAAGRLDSAIEILELARTNGELTRDGAKLLVDCSLQLHGIERAVAAALETIELLGVDNCRMVEKAAADAGAQAAAASLASAIRGRVASLPVGNDAHAT
jgi:hypothetical protein